MAIKSASTLVAEALKEIKTISPEEALEKLNNDCLLYTSDAADES